jgi:hypothetical protein
MMAGRGGRFCQLARGSVCVSVELLTGQGERLPLQLRERLPRQLSLPAQAACLALLLLQLPLRHLGCLLLPPRRRRRRRLFKLLER